MTHDLPETLTIIDVETTGLSPVYDRVIEVGAIRLEKGKKVAVFESFVNPHRHLPPEITRITGIVPGQLENAPDFADVRRNLTDLLNGSVLVAHNAGFDYAFLAEEFKRIEADFSYPAICTVRLFRHLYPGLRSYGLDALISHFGISIKNRHRALGDAAVLCSFLKIAKKQTNGNLKEAVAAATGSIPVPVFIGDRKGNPDNTPGVYTFISKNGLPLYIGKSKTVRSRLLSHFRSHHGISKRILIETDHVTVTPMPGELSALLHEQCLIKKEKPLHIKLLRITDPYILNGSIGTNGYYQFKVSQFSENNNQKSVSYGPFASRRLAMEFVRQTAKIHGLCEDILLGKNPKRSCLSHQLGECSGACAGKIKAAKFNMTVIAAFTDRKIAAWPYPKPVIVEEKGNGLSARYTINNWVIEKIESDFEIIPDNDLGRFSFDTYAILRKYLI